MIWDDLLPLTAIEYVIWRMMINYWTWGYKRFWTMTNHFNRLRLTCSISHTPKCWRQTNASIPKEVTWNHSGWNNE